MTERAKAIWRPHLHKTQMCRRVQNGNTCVYGTRCWFAHSKDEMKEARKRCKEQQAQQQRERAKLRRLEDRRRQQREEQQRKEEEQQLHVRAKNWRPDLCKTQMCHRLQDAGFCGFGTNCWFAHSREELLEARKRLQRTKKADRFVSKGNAPDRAHAAYHKRLPGYKPPPKLEAFRATHSSDVVDGALRKRYEQATRRELTKLSEMHKAASPVRTVDQQRQWWHTLLHCEDIQNANDMRLYDRLGVDLVAKPNGLIEISVPGLAEKRPGVLRGDEIRAIECTRGGNDDEDVPVHVGFVHFVNLDNVHVSFSHSVDVSRLHNIVFTMSRTQIRAMHRALDDCDFTPLLHCQFARDSWPLRIMNHLRELHASPTQDHVEVFAARLNTEQERFTHLALSGDANSYICWGPPGTGKTTTVVATLQKLVRLHKEVIVAEEDASNPRETARRIFLPPTAAGKQRRSSCRILVCAPSNDAATLITERIHNKIIKEEENTKTKLIHVFAASRDPSAMQKTDAYRYAPVEHMTSTGKKCFTLPAASQLRDQSSSSPQVLIVVCTLTMSGKLYGLFPHGERFDFDFVFIDEAAQSLYPQMLLAQCMAKSDATKVLLFGDPKQLGPQVRSRPATDHGFSLSALECWQTMPEYKDRFEEGSNLVMLVDNYRSHRDIIDCFNHAYDNRLQPFADHCDDPGAHTELVHVEGCEAKETDSPSLMNIAEIVEVFKIVAEYLFNNPTAQISDIVVLTPYIKQVKKISGFLHNILIGTFPMSIPSSVAQLLYDRYGGSKYDRKNQPLLVCTVESFQGREKPVVVLSTVRSHGDDEEIVLDLHRSLGFLCQPRRANVALSRAQHMMYIVGNGNLLCRDDFWGQALKKVKVVRNVASQRRFDPSKWKKESKKSLTAVAKAAARDPTSVFVAAGRTEEEEADDDEQHARERPFMAKHD